MESLNPTLPAFTSITVNCVECDALAVCLAVTQVQGLPVGKPVELCVYHLEMGEREGIYRKLG